MVLAARTYADFAGSRRAGAAMLDKLFFISLVLNASGLFRFVAPQVGVAIGRLEPKPAKGAELAI